MLMYYNGDVNGAYNGLFNPLKKEPFKAYYALKAFNELYALENEVSVTAVPDGISCVAACNDGECAVVITNTGEKKSITISSDVKKEFEVYRLNESMDLEFDCKTDLTDGIVIDEFETVLLK